MNLINIRLLEALLDI